MNQAADAGVVYVELIKFGTIDALTDYVNSLKRRYDEARNTWPNGFNGAYLNTRHKLKADLEYLQTKQVNWINYGKNYEQSRGKTQRNE